MQSDPRGFPGAAAPLPMGKLPQVTLAFWIMKICATTLGETAGDLLSMARAQPGKVAYASVVFSPGDGATQPFRRRQSVPKRVCRRNNFFARVFFRGCCRT